MTARIQNCIARVLKIDVENVKKIAGDEPMNALGLDSLNFVDCIVLLEQEFNIVFEDEELLLDNLNTINKLIKIIRTKSENA